MRVWRIARGIYPPLDGEGARRNGARWNSAGNPVVYTAGSLALAIVELLVHTDPDIVPKDLTAYEIDIPERVSIGRVSADDLPSGWAAHDDLRACQAWGDAWLRIGADGILAVPSAVVPEETNYLINPRHPEAEFIGVVSSRPFAFDARLFR